MPAEIDRAGDRPPTSVALRAAEQAERLSQAEWRRRRAEVLRLRAAGEDAAADALLQTLPDGSPPTARTARRSAVPHADAPSRSKSNDPAGQPAAKSPKPKRSAEKQPAGKRPATKTPASTQSNAKRAAPTVASSGSSQPVSDRCAPKAKQPKGRRTPIVRTNISKRKPPPGGVSGWVAKQPPWAVSAATHTAGLALLSLLTFATFGDPGFSLSASVGEDDAWTDVVAEVTLPDPTDEASDPAAMAGPLAVDLAVDLSLDALVTPVSLESSLNVGDLLTGDAASLMSAVPSAGESAGDGDGREAAPSASGGGRVAFFGSKAEAHRVAFVVDNSGSMQRGRLETTLMELDAAVWRLSPSQEFYVVFFSDQAYPMFFPATDGGPIPASEANKRELSAWLGTVEMCLGGRLLDAMEIAAAVEPDVAYLLTDGDIRSTRVRDRMTAEGAWPFPVHTLGMGARTEEHVTILRAIAYHSGGEYRPVDAIPAAVQRARAKPIPYHRTPGEVWGSAVQSW